MQLYLVAIYLVIFFFIEIFYFRIAAHYNIIDKPNHRSSHTALTIRGGGVIFCISVILTYALVDRSHLYYVIGLGAISIISFIDDIKPLSNKIRLTIHLVATALLFAQLELFYLPVYLILLSFIFVMGTINAVNFMDGINGITGGYGLLTISTLFYINHFLIHFISENQLVLPFLALVVFNFYNFRTKAKCFAGDVGSVGLAFIVVFLLLLLIIKTQTIGYLLLLFVYGLDTVTTILFRIIRKENIFEAHRSHFYQFLANQKKLPHLLVAATYIIAQLIVNVLLICFFIKSTIYCVAFITICTLSFIILRLTMEGTERLLKSDK